MTLIFLIILILFLSFDLGALKKRNPDAFAQAFTFSRLLWWGYGLLLIMLYPGGDPREYLLFFLAVLVLPLYVVRRIRYRKILSDSPVAPVAREEGDFNLALDAFGVILLWFLAMVGLNLIVEGIRWAFDLQWPQLAELVFQSAFSFILAFFLILRVIKKHKDLTLSGILGMDQKITFGKHVLLPIVIGLVLALLACGVLFSRPVQPATPLGDILEQTSSSMALISFLVIATLLAPLFEEIIFRGFFYHVASRMKGKVFAVILIGAVFGALHVDQYWGDWFSIAVVAVLGFVLTFFRAWTGSCLPSIVMHYIFNGAMTVIPILMLLTSNPSYFQYAFRYPVLEPEAKEQLLKESIRTDPQYAPAYNDLAWLYAEEKRNLEEGLTLVNKALEQDADNYAFLDTKAEVLYQMGRFDDALVIEESLLKRYPDDQYLKDQVKKFRAGPPLFETTQDVSGKSVIIILHLPQKKYIMKKTHTIIAFLLIFTVCGQGFCQEKEDLIGRALDDMEEVTEAVFVNAAESWEAEDKAVLEPEEEEPYIALLEFRETDIMTALNVIQDKVGAVIVPDALISGTVTIQLKSIGLNDAMRVVLEPNRLAYTESNGVYRVMTAEDYEREKGYSFIQGVRTRIVALDYAEFPDVIAKLDAIKSDSGRIYRSNRPRAVILIDHERVLDEMEEAVLEMDVEIETEIFALKNASAQEVADKIKNELSKNLGQIRADPVANKIVVTDTSANIEKIALLVQEFDVLREMELDAQVVQIVLNEEHKAGVDWEAIVSEYHGLCKVADDQKNKEKRELCLGTVTREDHEVLMEALEMVGHMRTFTMPASMIADKKEASVGLRMGDEDVSLLVSSPPEYASDSGKKEISDAIFHLAPRIHLDNTLALAVTPVLAMNKRTAQLELKDDQVIVIGGIFKEEMVSRIKKFPILGSIPLLGIMFRSRTSDVVRIEHVIFLFPKVKSAVKQ